MIIYPAIDILQGKCVRLTEGDFSRTTVFGEDPVAMALRWQQEGAEWLHIVDLDGAKAGRSVHAELIGRIVRAVSIPVQVGGGIRDLDTAAALIDLGVARVIFGSVAVSRPEVVREACQCYGEKIAVGIDAREGIVSVQGWLESGGVEAPVLARDMAAAGVKQIIYTDISRDGKLSGVNIEATRALADAAGIPVIASGGVNSVADIAALRQTGPAIGGVIVGKALYTGHVTLAEALAAAGREKER